VFAGEVTSRSIHRRRLSTALLGLLATLALAVIALTVASAAPPAPAAAATGGAGRETGGAGRESEAAPVEPTPPLGETAFDRQGMWVWYVSHSEGGNVAAILARAKSFDIGTVYVKAGDGGGRWSQFSSALVDALHEGGIDVCAWQYVYGEHPVAEAKVGIAAFKKGADCLAIDAEAEYEGRYAAAERYLQTLRAGVGESFPVSLAGFPYVDYHPAFPYSVFFGPGGAQYNQPQMYWKAIGTSVRTVYEHTFLFNRIWGRPVYPVGQTYEAPGNAALRLFRRFAASYDGHPPSWWDWQETSGKEWGALGATSALRPLTGYRQSYEQPLLKRGSKGDMVVWAQEHLISAGVETPINGIYGKRTYRAVREFQEAHGLPVDGQMGTTTWEALLTYGPAPVRWARGGGRASAAASRVEPARRPLSASLPAKGYEIPRAVAK
jgi:hypothetical protein